ncbi:MAG: TonB-dependent receptor, partial [Balneolaceae bacterium]
GGEMDGYQERTFHNGSEKATIYGAEFSLWQRLSFLPGALSNIGTFANYTWSASDFETNRPKETAFPGQSPHVVNVALDYTGDRFFAQVSYHRSARFLSLIEQESQIAPSLNASGQVYLDRYQDGYEDLSATFRYTLSRYFMIWANVSNLLRNEQLEYAYDRQFYQTSTYVRDGLELKLGVRFDL